MSALNATIFSPSPISAITPVFKVKGKIFISCSVKNFFINSVVLYSFPDNSGFVWRYCLIYLISSSKLSDKLYFCEASFNNSFGSSFFWDSFFSFSILKFPLSFLHQINNHFLKIHFIWFYFSLCTLNPVACFVAIIVTSDIWTCLGWLATYNATSAISSGFKASTPS